MFRWLYRKRAEKKRARDWHQRLLSDARAHDVYARGLVADTMAGRQGMVTLIATILFRSFREFGAEGDRLADALYREIFSGFDHALREEGIGDASIARRVRKIGEQFFGFAQALDTALDAEDRMLALQSVIRRNLQPDEDKARGLSRWYLAYCDSIRLTSLEPLSVAAPQIRQKPD